MGGPFSGAIAVDKIQLIKVNNLTLQGPLALFVKRCVKKGYLGIFSERELLCSSRPVKAHYRGGQGRLGYQFDHLASPNSDATSDDD